MDTAKRLLEQLQQRWQLLNPNQRLVVGCVLVGMLVTIFVSALLIRHVNYSMLYSGMDPERARVVLERLNEKEVSYRLSDGGRTILVPENRVATLRVELAGEASPGGAGVGYELFDRSRFGMTNFVQQVNLRRAIEGELRRTFLEMDEISGARVHLVIPERTLFRDKTRETSASVMLKLRPGVMLTRGQIAGIRALVAGSVEGLTAESVNLVDYNGNLITGDPQSPGDAGDGSMQIQDAVARALEMKAKEVLDHAVGPGLAVVQVNVELDTEMLERQVERFDPDGSVVRSEQTSEQGDAGSNGSTNTVTNYEINKTVEHIQRAPGSVKRLSASVAVDGRYEKAEDGDELVFALRPPEEMKKLEALIKNAMGINPERGDTFSIECVQFGHHPLKEEQAIITKTERRHFWQNIVGKAFWVIGAVGLLLVMLQLTRILVRNLKPALSQSPALAGADSGRLGKVIIGDDFAVPEFGQTSDAEPVRTTEPGDEVPRRVSEFTKKHPEESAAVIRDMIAEEV